MKMKNTCIEKKGGEVVLSAVKEQGSFHLLNGDVIPYKNLCSGKDRPYQISLKYF